MVSAESAGDFPKNRFPATFGGHLKILCSTCLCWKQSEIFDTPDICSLLATFCKIHFPATFGGLLEFLRYLFCLYIGEMTPRDPPDPHFLFAIAAQP